MNTEIQEFIKQNSQKPNLLELLCEHFCITTQKGRALLRQCQIEGIIPKSELIPNIHKLPINEAEETNKIVKETETKSIFKPLLAMGKNGAYWTMGLNIIDD